MMKIAAACLLLAFAVPASAAENTISRAEADQGWVLLFDGDSLFGWTAEGARWRAAGGVLEAPADGGSIRTNSAFADAMVNLEYRVTGPADCRLLFRMSAEFGVTHAGASTVLPPRSAPNQWHSVDATMAGERVGVRVDGSPVDTRDGPGRAGFLALTCSKGGAVQFRNIKLRPTGAKALFNTTDLSGWKAVAPPPKKAGMLKKMVGGGGQPEATAWAVRSGAIHGDGGTGQLETTAMYDNFVVQLAMRANSRSDNHPAAAVALRGDAGKLFTGYQIALMNDRRMRNGRPVPGATGGVRGLQDARRVVSADNQYFVETIAAHDRHIQVWVDGYPVSDVQDTRAEGTSPQKEARVSAGTISLQALEDDGNFDFRSVSIALLPKALGPVSGPPTLALPIPGTGAPGTDPAAGGADASKAEVQQLMAQVLATDDPQRHVELYTQILLRDPGNQVAFSGRKEAQQKIDDQRAKREAEGQKEEAAAKTESERQAQGTAALQRAETSFVSGNLSGASEAINAAGTLLPGDTRVQLLRTRIDQALSARQRVTYGLAGAGGLALVAGVIVFLRKRTGGERQAYLEVIDGVDVGRRYNLDQDVVHIGAVAQDGAHKNEIVVEDIEHLISRFHCEIHKQGAHYFLIDRGSSNGTAVDRKAVRSSQPVRLKSGARVDLAGTCTLRLGFEKKAAAGARK